MLEEIVIWLNVEQGCDNLTKYITSQSAVGLLETNLCLNIE